MAAYWGLFSIFAIGALFRHTGEGEGRARFQFVVALTLLALFVGLRWEVGPDWFSYLGMYLFYGHRPLSDVLQLSDPGFRALMVLLQSQRAPFWLLNLACAGIFSYGLARFCTTLPNPWLGVLVAIPYLVIVIAMSGIRQATALGFVFLALRHMGSKPLWKTVAWILVGSMFHASAFIVAVLVALSYSKSRIQGAVVLLACALPAYYVLFSTFDDYLKRYGQHRVDSAGVAFRVAMNALPAMIFLVRGSKALSPAGEEGFWRALSLLSLALIPATVFVHSTTVIDRLSLYAIPLQILVWSRAPGEFSTSPATTFYPVIAIIAYCALTLLIYFALGTHARFYLPYRLAPIW